MNVFATNNNGVKKQISSFTTDTHYKQILIK